MMRREFRGLLVIALLVASASATACVGPKAPDASAPYKVRLVGASDGALRGHVRGERSVFSGTAGKDYAVEVTNDTTSEIGLSIVIDGLDAKSGEPVSSCERRGGWTLPALGRAVIRGFSVSETRVATYRFAPRDKSLAAITKGARLESIGTVEVCIFSTRPRTTPVVRGETTFGGVVEREPTPAEAPVVGVVREEPSSGYATVEQDKLVSRIIVLYEGDDGPLGTAPPPAGIARVDPGPRPDPAPAPASEAEPPIEDPKATKPTKPTKTTKTTKTPTVKGSKPEK